MPPTTDFGVPHRKVCYEPWFIKEPEKNNELIRTETNSGNVSSYGVRPSSLLIFSHQIANYSLIFSLNFALIIKNIYDRRAKNTTHRA